MTVCFQRIKDFVGDKQEQIAKLVAQRVTLLVGKKYSLYIDSVSFCTNLENCKNAETDTLIEGKALIRYNFPDRQQVSAIICLSEKMLLDILTPGPGQAEFDELFLRIRNVLFKKVS